MLAAPCKSNGSHEEQVRKWLANLRAEGLPRSSRLRNDLTHISEVTGEKLDQRMVKRFRHTTGLSKDEIMHSPHLLVAYAWVMYMAVFSGGRWIRQQLSNAGDDFWSLNQQPFQGYKDGKELNTPGFTFLSFNGEEDGEDIKNLFKIHLAEAETLLTPQEKQQIVARAEAIFDDCIGLVHELDRRLWWRSKLQALQMVGLWLVAFGIFFFVYRSGNFGIKL
jgi:hypothetical protein